LIPTVSPECAGAGKVGGIRSPHLRYIEAMSPVTDSTLTRLDLSEAAQLVRAGEVSPVELTSACIERIERVDPALNTFITVTADAALAEARAAESELARGRWRGPLHGIPIALKDMVDTTGVRTTAASGLHAERVPVRDAEVVRRLRKAGAVCLGKLNMHELAYGASSVVSRFGPVSNPWGGGYTSGGSSSGAAVAVAARMCYGAVGSDTGGSIRQPAAFCNVVGLKPTYGRVSLRGVIPLSLSNDHVGPMTRSALDAALMLQVMAGYDPEDITSIDLDVPDYAAGLTGTSGVRLGLPRAHFFEGLHVDVEAALDAALAVLAEITVSQAEIQIPVHDDTTVFGAEIYASYGEAARRSPDLFQPDTLDRIRRGADVDASTYIEARRLIEELRRGASKIFDGVDLLVTPTTVVPPFETSLAQTHEELRALELVTLRNTRPFNALGLPAVSVPCGVTSDGLPIGLQITGPAGGEEGVLAFGHAYQQRTDWHGRWPPGVEQ